MTITRLGGFAALTLATTLLAGCSLFADAERQTVDPAPGVGADPGPFPDYVAEPLPEFERSSDPRITAVHDLIVANYEAIAAEDWAQACSFYSAEYVKNRIVTVANAPEGSSCEEALEYAYGGATEFIASFDAEKNAEGMYLEQQLMPYWYTPTEIAIDDSEITADNDRLVYVTALAIHGNSEFAFKDDEGEFARPGNSAPWQVVSTYFGLIDGEWTYLDTPEKIALE